MTNRPLARDIVSITFLVLCIGGLMAMNFWILRPFLLALICATIFVVATWPIMSRIQQWLGDKRSLTVVILTKEEICRIFTTLYYTKSTPVSG